MNNHTILFTGDFWHTDFKSIISSIDVPLTLVPINKIDSVSDSKFDLIVIAQSRRDQFNSADVEKAQNNFSNTPIVSLLGSWCEGETRSGTPYPGLIRVYWHQWQGRYQKFVEQLAKEELTEWHAPVTSSIADRIGKAEGLNPVVPSPHFAHSRPTNAGGGLIRCVGISAWTNTQHEMLADAVNQFGWESRWVERGAWVADREKLVSILVVDADSWSNALANRMNWLRSEFPTTRMVLLLNYPREDELESIYAAGVSAVVSKPFELQELKSAMERSVVGQPV
ncbi:MAG: hypothetical protein AB8B55_18515 [Mariniblastus sp.]